MAKPFLDLYLIKHFLDEEVCRELIVEMRRSASSPSLVYGSDESGSVDQRIRRVTRVTPLPPMVAEIKRRLIERRDEVGAHFGLTLRDCEAPQFLRYQVGDFFVAHQDGNTGMIQLESDRTRKISVSVFLNPHSETPAPGSFSGGSLVLSDWRRWAERHVQAETGTLVAFRSETTHEVTPVTEGERWAIVTWFG